MTRVAAVACLLLSAGLVAAAVPGWQPFPGAQLAGFVG